MNVQEINDLSREELIQMIQAQAAQISALQKGIEVLRLKLEKNQKSHRLTQGTRHNRHRRIRNLAKW